MHRIHRNLEQLIKILSILCITKQPLERFRQMNLSYLLSITNTLKLWPFNPTTISALKNSTPTTPKTSSQMIFWPSYMHALQQDSQIMHLQGKPNRYLYSKKKLMMSLWNSEEIVLQCLRSEVVRPILRMPRMVYLIRKWSIL